MMKNPRANLTEKILSHFQTSEGLGPALGFCTPEEAFRIGIACGTTATLALIGSEVEAVLTLANDSQTNPSSN
jgi:hypothetical protein